MYAVFPGHALHEKGLQKQKGVVPLVSSQEERALLVPVINLVWLSMKSCPTGEMSQLQKPASKTARFRMQILRAHLHAPGCAGRRRVHAAEACRLRATRRAECAPQDAPVGRRKMRRLRAGRRAGCASQDAPVARRKTRRLRSGRRAGCTPEDVPVTRRKTCRLHPARRAGSASCARRVRALAGRAVRFGLSLLARVSQSSAVGPWVGGGTPGVAPRSTGRSPRS